MLEVVPQEQYPFIPAGLVHQSAARRRLTSCRMEDDFKYRPCIMDPYWFGLMMKGNDDSAKLLHPALLAQAKLFYYLAEGDNGTVEALNAALRRQVVANVQCKTLDIEDLSAAFVIRSSSEEALSVFGDGHPPDLSEDAVNGGTGGGGGGLMRAFISQYKGEHKDDKGRIDFKSAHVAYNRERDLPQSDVLDNLKPVAEVATEASRALRGVYGTCKNAPQSGFGTVSGVARKQMETQSRMQMMLNDMGIVDDPVVCAHPSTAIVPRMVPLDGMAELVSRLGGELQPLDLQRRLVTQLFWARRAHERNLQHKELAQVTQWVRVAKDIRGIDLSKFIVPEGGFLRQFTWSKFPMLQWCDPSLKRVIATVAKLSRQRSDGNKTAEALLKHWEQEHTCEPDQSFERIGDLPTSAKPLPCSRTADVCAMAVVN